MGDIIQEILDRELKEGKIKDYNELMKRKAELQGLVKVKRAGSNYFSSIVVLLVLAIVIVAAVTWMTGGFDLFTEKIDVSQDPVQTECSTSETLTLDIDGDRYYITPVADYKIAAKVVVKKRYPDDISANITPYDLGCIWGEVVNKKNDPYLKYNHNDRTMTTLYYPGCPLTYDYVKNHISNNHLILPNENIKKAVDEIKVGQYVIVEGYLVNINATVKGKKAIWKASLTRSDSGDHGCEIIYVKRVTIGKKTYE